MDKPKFAKGVYLTAKKSKAGKDYLHLSLKQEDGTYKNFRAFLSEKTDKWGNLTYTVYDSDPAPLEPNEALPF